MNINTYLFGNIAVKDEELLTFDHGIPGFETLRSFVYVREPDDGPFVHLQSIEDGNIAFTLANPFYFYPEYDFVLPASAQEELKIQDEADVEVWGIVTVGEKIAETTLNLMGPIIVNKKEKKGKQVLLVDAGYQTKHPLVRSTVQHVNRGRG